MKHPKKIKITGRQKRARRVRTKIFGTANSPRLSVHRSLKNIFVQLINDDKGISLIGVSSLCQNIKEQQIEGGKISIAKAVGRLAAEKAKEKDISKIVFDRNGYLYHGRIKAVAEGAREGGLIF